MIDRKYRVRATPEVSVSDNSVALATSIAQSENYSLEAERAVKDAPQIPPAGDGTYLYISAPESY